MALACIAWVNPLMDVDIALLALAISAVVVAIIAAAMLPPKTQPTKLSSFRHLSSVYRVDSVVREAVSVIHKAPGQR